MRFQLLILLIMLVVPTTAIQAQAAPGDSSNGTPLFSALGLSDGQRVRLRAASAQWRAEVETIKARDAGVGRGPTVEGMMALKQAVERHQKRVHDILTPAQRTLFVELLAQRDAEFQRRLASRQAAAAPRRPVPVPGTKRGSTTGPSPRNRSGGAR